MKPEELKELKELTSQKFKELEEKMVSGEDVDTLRPELEKANELAGQANDAAVKQAELATKQQEQLDALETKMKEYKDADKKGKIVSPLEFFKEELKNSESFQAFRKNTGNSVYLDAQRSDEGEPTTFEKAMYGMLHKTITQSDNWTGDVAQVDRVSNVTWVAPHEQMRIRSLMNVGSTESNVVDFVQATVTNNAAGVAEAATKPSSDATFEAVQATVQVLAHLFPISRQALNDYGQMATFLSSEGIAGLKDVEDNQLLNGSGTGANLNGVITQAGTTFSGGAATDTYLDTLLKAVYVLKEINYRPNGILIPPSVMREIKLLKDSTGQYIFPNFLPTGLANPVSVDGVPVIEHTKVPDDTFLCGDFMRSAVFDRESANVRFSEEDGTNFQKNLITVRVEERLTLAVFDPNAFVSTTFALAKTLT